MANCSQCNRQLVAGQEILIKETKSRNAPFLPYCSLCAAEKEKQNQLETQEINYFGGLLLGGAAGIVSALIWYAIVIWTETQFVYLAVALGFLVGMGVMFGAGNKRGLPLQVMAAAITLAAMAMGEYFIVRHWIVEVMRAEGHRHFPLLYPLETVVEFLKAAIESDPIILLFWLIALVVAFFFPVKRKLIRQDPSGGEPYFGS